MLIYGRSGKAPYVKVLLNYSILSFPPLQPIKYFKSVEVSKVSLMTICHMHTCQVIYHSVLHVYYDVDLLLTLSLFSPSLSHFVPSTKNKWGCQACRHLSHACHTDDHRNYVRDRRKVGTDLRAQTLSSEPAYLLWLSPLLRVHFKERLSWDEKTYYRVSMAGLPFTQPTLETTKAQALLVIYTNQPSSHMAGLYWRLYRCYI